MELRQPRIAAWKKFPNIYAEAHAEGGQTRHSFERDPRHLGFVLARYKHVAKMLAGKERVLEVGCGDGFASRIVRQHVKTLTAIDADGASIAEAQARISERWPITFVVQDFMAEPFALPWGWDAVYALDVFEHIEDTRRFLSRLRSAAPVAVIGTPSLESQAHASALSREGHVSCLSGEDLRKACLAHWGHVFMFSMHDEAIGTGFLPMANYLLVLCVA
jgi:2-polyprenyl-3-methyl-5-hydroxy-6-metoxy-1,4-benzoquinol methylase